MQAKRFFFEKKKQKTFIHCRRHGVRTENSVPSETDKSFLVLFCKKERLALLRFQWVDLPGQKPFFQKKKALSFLQKRNKKLLSVWCESGHACGEHTDIVAAEQLAQFIAGEASREQGGGQGRQLVVVVEGRGADQAAHVGAEPDMIDADQV